MASPTSSRTASPASAESLELDAFPIGWVDAAVIVGYLGLLGLIAWRARRPSSDTEDYFLAGHSIPWWAAGLSLLATALSGATFIAVPADGVVADFTYLMAGLAPVVAIVIVIRFFVPAFFRYRVRTVYGLLGARFGPGAAMAGSWFFILGRFLASGARLFIAALALAYIAYPAGGSGMVVGAILLIAVVGLIYTFAGGIRCVIWTDVCQAGVFVIAGLATLITLWWLIPADADAIIRALADPGDGRPSKLRVFAIGLEAVESGTGFGIADFFHPDNKFSIPSIVLGLSIFNLGAYGTDQDLAQRMLACRDAKSGMRTALTAVLAAVPITAMFLAIGMLLYVFYQRPDLMGDAAPAVGAHENYWLLFPDFIARHLPWGIRGLLVAGLLAMAVSSLTSELNAIASAFVHDCYRPLAKAADERRLLIVGRLAVLAAALCLAAAAVLCMTWFTGESSLLAFAFRVMGYAYAGLVGVFLCAVWLRRGTQTSAIAALFLAAAAYALMQHNPWWLENVAFTWQLLLAATLAFLVCALGRNATPTTTEVQNGR